ncbi:MAG: sugar ABC transporter ATP-binding protein [Pyrinomonadaceae bacterium]
MPILQLREIVKHFGPTVALDGIDLDLRDGEVHALIGENGAGKSTLMNILHGAFRPYSGSMELKGTPYHPVDSLDARRHGISLIHQELMLAPHLSVAENILMGIENFRFGWFDKKALHKRALSVLENFDHPDIRPEATTGELSTAAQQVVEICRAVASNSRILLMDEPTSSLQRHDVERLFGLIRGLKADGASIIYISHFLEEIREIADNFTVLRDGKSVATGKIGEVSDQFLVSHMVGRTVENLFPKRTINEVRETVLKVQDLSSPPALRSANFELRRGEILGIAGLMGSGRSDMVRAIFRLVDAASGTITIEGNESQATRGTPAARISQGIGYLSEDRKREGLALSLSVADNITMTRFSSCSRFGWLDLSKQRRRSEEMIAQVGIKAAGPAQPLKELSGGNQQKVAVARLIHQNADVLLLDEPTRGVDIVSKAQVYDAIARCAADGKAVLMISSYLPELFGMCDRLAVMSRGRLSHTRKISEWTPESVLQEAIGSN